MSEVSVHKKSGIIGTLLLSYGGAAAAYYLSVLICAWGLISSGIGGAFGYAASILSLCVGSVVCGFLLARIGKIALVWCSLMGGLLFTVMCNSISVLQGSFFLDENFWVRTALAFAFSLLGSLITMLPERKSKAYKRTLKRRKG